MESTSIPSVYQSRRTGQTLQGSDAALAFLNERYGAVKYNQQSVKRYPYYYRYAYPVAGTVTVPFFGTGRAQSGDQITNIEQPNNFGNVSYLIEAFSFDYYLALPGFPATYTTDASTVYSDLVHGFTQAGFFSFSVGNLNWLQMPLPFKSMPPADGRVCNNVSMGAFAFDQSGMSPFGVTGGQTVLCAADLERRALRKFKLQNNIFLAPQQTFQAQINYDVGAVPAIGTDVITSGTVLYLECRIDGWLYEGLM